MCHDWLNVSGHSLLIANIIDLVRAGRIHSHYAFFCSQHLVRADSIDPRHFVMRL